MTTTTIKSNSKIVYDNYLHSGELLTESMFSFPETQVTITYRRFNLYNDNLTGDQEKSDYTEYSLNAVVSILLMDDKIVTSGEMQSGDAELFIKPYINHEIDNTIISEPFEPQIDDEFIFQNRRFRINLIRPEMMNQTKLYLDCLCSRLENDNPEHTWNENYDTSEGYN